mgnify:CR=1 FL=1|tara:strand:+ start:1009 stop:1335 length:327 start_codon:yes stop_codon:yes gene_type:complete
MLQPETKQILKELKDINIELSVKRSIIHGKVQTMLIKEQVCNLKNYTVILSGHIKIYRDYDNTACFECENQVTKLFFGVYKNKKCIKHVSLKDHLEIQRAIEDKIKII